MNVGLIAEPAAYVGGKVAFDALRLLRRERAAHEEKPAILGRDIQIGFDDIEAGRISSDTMEDIARETLAAHRARRA